MNKVTKYSFEWLTNPEIFAVNRLAAHSDHYFYEAKPNSYGEEMELKQSLNGKWKYSYAENLSKFLDGFYEENFELSDFTEIKVPGHIELQGFDKCQYTNMEYPWEGHEDVRPPFIPVKHNPTSHYVTFFDLKEELSGKKLILSFQGVESAFYAWVNGAFVGYSTDSFTPSEFDITEFVKPTGNKLAVLVLKRSCASWLEDQDFFRFSGIFRDVFIYAVPKTHVRDIFVHADLDDEYRDGALSFNMELEGEIKGSLGYELVDKNGKTVLTRMGIAMNSKMELNATVKDVLKWSAEIPDLYLLNISLYDENGELIEYIPQRIGFRRFEMKEGVMCINGKRIMFKGVNRHEFSCRNGRALTRFEMDCDIAQIKQLNINAVRTCHYPDQSYWYELCDQFGIYLIDETNLETHGTWGYGNGGGDSYIVPGNNPIWAENVLDRAKSMLERDKNHPSVLIWSCGNESHAGEDILGMTKFFHERDPKRLVHYESCVHDRNYSDITDMESRMYAKPDEIAEYLDSNPAKPYISCEYTHAMGNSCGGMFKYTELADKYEKYQGGFIWDFADQALLVKDEEGKSELKFGGDFGDRPNDHYFCGNGIVFADRKQTPKAQEVKYLYQNIKLFPTNLGVLIVNESLFESTYDYIFEARLLKDGKAVWAGSFCCDVPAGSEEFVPITYPEMLESGEYIIEVRAMLIGYRPWTNPGFLAAWGQSSPIVVEKEVGQVDIRCEAGAEVFEDVIMTVGFVGAKTANTHAIFSRVEGGLISFKVKGLETLECLPKINLFRAGTDNDKGNHYVAGSSVYMGASKYQKLRSCEVSYTMKDGSRLEYKDAYARKSEITKITVVSKFAMYLPFEVINTVTYDMTPDGKIKISALYPGAENLPQLPCFGLTFVMDKQFGKLEYYGRGPEENYNDRCKGARLGIFKGSVSDNLTPYLDPQECGNRSEVRYIKVVDEFGHGLKFTASTEKMDASVLPYSQFELDEAYKREWLPKAHRTYVELRGAMRGVGGDDTWGAPVHPEFCVSSKEAHTLEIMVEGL